MNNVQAWRTAFFIVLGFTVGHLLTHIAGLYSCTSSITTTH